MPLHGKEPQSCLTVRPSFHLSRENAFHASENGSEYKAGKIESVNQLEPPASYPLHGRLQTGARHNPTGELKLFKSC